MTDENPPAAPPERGRRKPPTIDLTATELASQPAATPSTAEVSAAAAEAPPPESPGPEPERAHTEEGAAAQRSTQFMSAASLPADFPWPLIGAGVAGAALALALFFVVGLFSKDSGTGALEARLVRAEAQLRELASRPQQTNVDPKSVEDLGTRVARLEGAVAQPRTPAVDPALANRISTLEGELKALGETVAVLGRRNDESASAARDARQRADANAAALAEITQKLGQPGAPVIDRKEVDALTNRVATIERNVKTLETDLAKRVGEGSDRSVRLAFAANGLRAAVERGDPFAAELAAAKTLAADATVLAPLEPFAAIGVPTADALARELSELVPALSQAAGVSAVGGTFFERLRANAERIVRVRRVEDVAGDDAAAVIARVEARAARGDLAGALAELAKLPVPARAQAQPLIDKAQARTAAVEASRKFAAAALAAIGKS